MSSSTEFLRRKAKALRKAFLAGDPEARTRVAAHLPGRDALKHADALHVVAREQGFQSWPKLKLAKEIAAMDRAKRSERLKIALYFGQSWVVDALLSADPSLGSDNPGLQAALYQHDAVSAALARDPALATGPVAGPRSLILHLAFSQHWRHHPDGANASVRMAELLVSHGASVSDGFPAEPGSSHTLSVLYGALGHAGNHELAKWLLEAGADPNDNESLYHACELGHAEGVRLLLKHGADPVGTNALLRAMDFNNLELVELLLGAGADPDEGVSEHPGSDIPEVLIPGLHQAARLMCSGAIAEALIRAGADGTRLHDGHTAYALARMRGNRDVASVLEAYGQASPLDPEEALLAQAAEGPVEGGLNVQELSDLTRLLIHRMLGTGGTVGHIKRLIDLGLDPNALDEQGMSALHIAAWEGLADEVALLIGHCPDLEYKNMYGGDALGTAIHGSEFCPARNTRDHLGVARLLLDAGANLDMRDVDGCGVEAMAEMLRDWAEAHPERVVET
ncbi:MAG: ankyrin repeat domain-containing protein, partial [Pseudomonadota bacterium]